MSDYMISWLADGKVLTLTLSGFWQEEQVAAFQATLAAAVRQSNGRSFDLIADLSSMPLQSSAVVARQTEAIAVMVAGGMRKLIIVGASALLRMQIRRAYPDWLPIFAASMDIALGSVSDTVAESA